MVDDDNSVSLSRIIHHSLRRGKTNNGQTADGLHSKSCSWKAAIASSSSPGGRIEDCPDRVDLRRVSVLCGTKVMLQVLGPARTTDRVRGMVSLMAQSLCRRNMKHPRGCESAVDREKESPSGSQPRVKSDEVGWEDSESARGHSEERWAQEPIADTHLTAPPCNHFTTLPMMPFSSLYTTYHFPFSVLSLPSDSTIGRYHLSIFFFAPPQLRIDSSWSCWAEN